MSAKEQIKQLVDYFKREPLLKDKTNSMGDGLLLGAQLADEANERSIDSKATVLAIQERYIEQILAQDLNPNKDPELVDLRGGKATAGERMTAFEQSTTAQFQQNKLKLKPKNHLFGGQLKKLRHSLYNPLEQFVSIQFIADSIGWGLTLPNNSAQEPRTGELSDPRDSFQSDSFVNLFKRHIKNKYIPNSTEVLSNWSSSSSGQSTVEYSKEQILVPFDSYFNWTYIGTPSLKPALIPSTRSLTGFQIAFTAEKGSASHVTCEFTFTGNAFTISYDSLVSGLDYELFVDDVSQGVFGTSTTVVAGEYDKRRTHSFPYINNKKIKIVSVFTSLVGYQTLRISGLIINKKIRITNNGIIGITAKKYKTMISEAVKNEDKYVFIQLGTNDRLNFTDTPLNSYAFKSELTTLVDSVSVGREIILMNANPVANDNPASFRFSMQDVRDTVYSIGYEKKLDIVDNFTIFEGVSVSKFTADGLHPNSSGHIDIFYNIINSID